VTWQLARSPVAAAQVSLPNAQPWLHTPVLAHPKLDYSHLSPEERLQLVEDLWDSLAAYRRGETATRPWREALDAI